MRRFSLLVCLVFCALAAHAADTVVMTTKNLIVCDGQLANSNTITLSSWSWSTSSPDVIGTGAAKTPALSQISLAKVFDKCTSSMLDAYFGKKVIATVVIEQAKAGPSATTVPLAEVTLTNAYIASYGIVGNTTTEATETWTLSFDKICVTTYGQLPDGAAGPGTTVCYGGESVAQQQREAGNEAFLGIRAIQEVL